LSATRIGSLQVGRYTLDVVSEFEGPRILPRELYPTLQESHLASIIPHLPKSSFDMGSKTIVTSVHTWLIRDGSGLVLLVDTCFGNNKLRPAYPLFNLRQTDWLEQLAALGVSPADVTHVINTHLDHDRVGWKIFSFQVQRQTVRPP
jgi:Metallo-beta-lactamase superfamily